MTKGKKGKSKISQSVITEKTKIGADKKSKIFVPGISDQFLLAQLESVSEKINIISSLPEGIIRNGKTIPQEKLLDDLRKKKSELITKFRKESRKRPEKEMKIEPLWDPHEFTGRYQEAIKLFKITDIGEIVFKETPSFNIKCNTRIGYVEYPSRKSEMLAVDVHHESTFSVSADFRELDNYGYVRLDCELDDDDSPWRWTDNPDYIKPYIELVWKLPAIQCSSTVYCYIDVRHAFKFTRASDEFAYFRTSAAMVASDDNGVFPGVDIGGPNRADTDLITTISQSTSRAHTDTGFKRFYKVFHVEAGAKISAALGHFIFLGSKDGLVHAEGSVGTHCIHGDAEETPPKLFYIIVPD